jgi:hypothetical protein
MYAALIREDSGLKWRRLLEPKIFCSTIVQSAYSDAEATVEDGVIVFIARK